MFKPLNEIDFIAITLLNVSYEELSTKLEQKLVKSGQMTFKWDSEIMNLDIRKIINGGQIYGGNADRKFVVWPFKYDNNKSVFLSNRQDGSLTIINMLQLPNEFIRIRVSSKESKNSMNEFEYVKNGKTRLVHSYWDSDKWVFYQRGGPSPFENIEYYKRRIKKDRINYSIINEYLEANGWYLNNEDFWHSDIATYFIERNFLNKNDTSLYL